MREALATVSMCLRVKILDLIDFDWAAEALSLIHISEPTRPY